MPDQTQIDNALANLNKAQQDAAAASVATKAAADAVQAANAAVAAAQAGLQPAAQALSDAQAAEAAADAEPKAALEGLVELYGYTLANLPDPTPVVDPNAQ